MWVVRFIIPKSKHWILVDVGMHIIFRISNKIKFKLSCLSSFCHSLYNAPQWILETRHHWVSLIINGKSLVLYQCVQNDKCCAYIIKQWNINIRTLNQILRNRKQIKSKSIVCWDFTFNSTFHFAWLEMVWKLQIFINLISVWKTIKWNCKWSLV